MRLRFLIPIAVFALLLVLFMVGLGLDPEKVPSPLIGKRAPAFELDTVAGEADISEKAFERHRVSLFNVWASWCVACRQEHPFLMQLARRDVVPIYGLNYKDERADAQRWLRRLGDPYTASAMDRDGRVGIDWGVYGVPETFVIDGRGVIRYKHIGPLTEQAWHDEVRPVVERIRREEN